MSLICFEPEKLWRDDLKWSAGKTGMFQDNFWSCLDEGQNVFNIDNLFQSFVTEFYQSFNDNYKISPIDLNQGSVVFNFWHE